MLNVSNSMSWLANMNSQTIVFTWDCERNQDRTEGYVDHAIPRPRLVYVVSLYLNLRFK